MVLGFFAPWLLCAAVLALHLVLPARRVRGYVRGADGEPLAYRLNGLLVFAVALATWFLAGKAGVVSWTWLWQHRWAGLAGAVTLGLLFTAAVVLPARSRRSLLADLFYGRLENPQAFGRRVDAKMFLYLFGATLLGLNILSFAAHHVLTYPGDPSPGVLLYAGLFGWFLVDYLTFERVHLYTYDFVAERVGFKLGWGCLAFYPYFYCVGLWSVADKPNPHTPTGLLVGYAAVFFAGWVLARGANMQKYLFKTAPGRSFLGVLPPRTIEDGRHKLLCNGFWGVARHVNYLGEILMATGLALALGWPGEIWPWLYPLYYVALLLPRQIDDDRRCAAKYGPLWDEYRRRVPRRIVPGVY